LVSQAIVQPVNEVEIITLFKFSKQYKIPIVFRTGGTSLSGQSITDGVLVDSSQYWNKIVVEKNGAIIAYAAWHNGCIGKWVFKKVSQEDRS
jgi:D-lactate dehydrogenase